MKKLTKNEALQRRVARIRGQVDAIGRMVERDANVIDLAYTIYATRRALDSLSTRVIKLQLENTVVNATKVGPSRRRAYIEEFMDYIGKFIKR